MLRYYEACCRILTGFLPVTVFFTQRDRRNDQSNWLYVGMEVGDSRSSNMEDLLKLLDLNSSIKFVLLACEPGYDICRKMAYTQQITCIWIHAWSQIKGLVDCHSALAS